MLFAHATIAADRPNILFISIDDLRPQLGAYGEAIMVTPNLDQLASEGRLFSRHYVQVPTCGPSRAVMLTGKNLRSTADIRHRHLADTLAAQSRDGSPETFIEHLKNNGYHTVGMGKISHDGDGRHNGQLELPHSWSEFVHDVDGPWKGGGALLHAYANGRNRYQEENPPPFESLDVPDEAYPDGRLANLAVAQLEKLSEQPEPFFMAVGFYKPHLPFSAPTKYWDLYDREEAPISPNPSAPLSVDDVFLHPSDEFFKYNGGRESGGVRQRLSDDYAREINHAYLAATSYADAQVGKVLQKLEATGLADNTIVIVWSDHGWHLGDHAIWGKHSPFDRALHSVLIVKTPEIPAAGKSTDGLVASLDLYPTICELAGIAPPTEIEGTSFGPQITDPQAPGRPAVHSYWRNIISIRTDRYRLALYNDGTKESAMLFDHETDPNETNNIAVSHPEIIESLLPLLESGNRGFLPTVTP